MFYPSRERLPSADGQNRAKSTNSLKQVQTRSSKAAPAHSENIFLAGHKPGDFTLPTAVPAFI
jgi:hypothetical protein